MWGGGCGWFFLLLFGVFLRMCGFFEWKGGGGPRGEEMGVEGGIRIEGTENEVLLRLGEGA